MPIPQYRRRMPLLRRLGGPAVSEVPVCRLRLAHKLGAELFAVEEEDGESYCAYVEFWAAHCDYKPDNGSTRGILQYKSHETTC